MFQERNCEGKENKVRVVNSPPLCRFLFLSAELKQAAVFTLIYSKESLFLFIAWL